MKKTLFRTIMCVGIASMLLGGCTNDDVYNPEAVVKRYENAWEKQFGKVDPNQTWNTAKQVTANIDLTPLAGDYTLKIYTANPINKGACLLAKKQINGSGSIDVGGMNEESVLDILTRHAKPVLMSIIKGEIFEEGDLAYDF